MFVVSNSLPETGTDSISERHLRDRNNLLAVPVEDVNLREICNVCMDRPADARNTCVCSLKVCTVCVAIIFRTREPETASPVPVCPGCRRPWPYEIAQQLVNRNPDRFSPLTRSRVNEILRSPNEETLLTVLGQFILQQREVIEENIGVPAHNFEYSNLPLWSVSEEMNRKIRELETRLNQTEDRADRIEENVVRQINRQTSRDVNAIEPRVNLLVDQVEMLESTVLHIQQKVTQIDDRATSSATETTEIENRIENIRSQIQQLTNDIDNLRKRSKENRPAKRLHLSPVTTISVLQPAQHRNVQPGASHSEPVTVSNSEPEAEVVEHVMELSEDAEAMVRREILQPELFAASGSQLSTYEPEPEMSQLERQLHMELPSGALTLNKLDYVARFRMFANDDLATPEGPIYANFTKNQNINAISRNLAQKLQGQMKRCEMPVTVSTPWRIQEEFVTAKHYINTVLYGHHMKRRPVFRVKLHVIDHVWWHNDLLLGRPFAKFLKGYKPVSCTENSWQQERAEENMYVDDSDGIRTTIIHSRWNYGRYRRRMTPEKLQEVTADIRAGYNRNMPASPDVGT